MTTQIAGADGKAQTATLPVQIGYGVGQIAGQVFRDLPSLLLLFFMTTVIGLSPGIAGAAIFVPKLVMGLVCDMSVGILSDKLRHRIARRWWLLGGVFLSPVAMILLFHVPAGSDALKIAYIAGVFTLYMAVFASFSVPYLAIAGELSASPEDRNRLMAWRLVFTSIGVLVAGAVAPALVDHFGGGQSGYEDMAVVLAVICPLALLVAFFSTRGRSQNRAGGDKLALAEKLTPGLAMKKLFGTPFTLLAFVNLLQLTGQGMSYAALLYFLSYNMGRTDALSLMGGVVLAACAGIIVAQPLWVKLAERIGKRDTYISATVLFFSGYILWGMSASWGPGASYFFSFFTAIGNSGWAMLGFSMVSDIAAEDEEYAGLYAAAWIALDKISFALGGTLLVGLVLSAFDFDSAKAVAGLPQADSALTGIVVAFAAIPVTLNIIGATLLWRFGTYGRRAPKAGV